MTSKNKHSSIGHEILVVIVLTIVFLLASCNEGSESENGGASAGAARDAGKSGAQLSGDAIGTIEGKSISKAVFDSKVEVELSMYAGGGVEVTDEMRRGTKRSVFARMASDELVMLKAEELGVALSKEEAKADVDKVVERMGGEDAVLAFLGGMGGGIKTIDEFVAWKRAELSREALIDKVGGEVEIDEAALKAEFDKLMADYETARNAGKPAIMPGGSFEEFVERRKLQERLVKFDEFIDAALTTAKVVVTDPDLEGAIDEFVKLSFDQTATGMNPHGGGMGGSMHGIGNPHGGMDMSGGAGGKSPHGDMGGGSDKDKSEGSGKDIGSAHG